MSSDYNIYELLDLLSKDNLQVTINSSDAAEKLSFSLLRMLKEIEEDSSIVPSFLSKGILYVIQFFQQFFAQLSDTSECNPNIFASFEDILEILNSIADTGIQTKCTVVLQFGEDLIHYINNQFLPFNFRLKIVKYTNLLFEKCPTYVKDCLYAKSSYKKKLKNALKLISSIGDYEFQVCIIEFVFRAVSKQKRVEALNTLCPPEILASILAIKDESFEVDCRRVLNAFNSQNGTHQSVFSIPCLEVTLGNLELHKPRDDDYKEFWIDFNTGSKRISFYCSQIIDNEDPETDEDIWESICILKDYVQEISSNDDNDEVLAVQLKFLPLSVELISGVTLEKLSFIKLLFKDKDAVMKAIQEIFCTQKCSIAKNQICIKEQKEKPFFPPHSVCKQEEPETMFLEAAPSVGSSQQSARKSSVPSEIMSTQNSGNGRHHEVGAIRICRQAESSGVLNHSSHHKTLGSTQKSKSKANNETVKQKEERTYKNPPPQNHNKKEQKKEPVSSPSKPIAGQPESQLKSAKNKNSISKPFVDSYIPGISNMEELMSKIPKNGKDQSFQKRKQSLSESTINVKEKTRFDYSSAEEVEDEAIPPTFEITSASKDFMKSKKLTSPPIQDSKTSNYKQNKTPSTANNSDNSSSNINPSVKSIQSRSRKASPVETKQSESVKEDLKKKEENKSPPNPKNKLQEKEEKSVEKTQLGKVARSDKANELKKQPKDLISSPNHNISSNNESSLTDKGSLNISKEQKSIVSQSPSIKRTNSDKIISSQMNNSEANPTTASRKGRRLRSFDTLDLLPQNYPLPKDVKRTRGTPKRLGTSKKRSSSTPNITTKLLEEEKVMSIKETQPEPTKVDEVTLIPDSFPQQNGIGKPEEDQPKQKLTAVIKLSSKKKLAVDSGISSSNNSPACGNDVPSTSSKKRCSYSPPQKTQRNISSSKQAISQPSYDKNPLPKTSGKINNEIEKIEKTQDPKKDKDNNQKLSNKPIAKEKEESSYKFPSQDTSPVKSQVSCYAPITQDNLSKFNKEGQKNLAKELDERIEEFVKASCQNISDGSNGSPFDDSTLDAHKEIQPVSFNKSSQQDSTCDQTDRDEHEQPYAEDDPLPSQQSQEGHPKSPPVVINTEEELFKAESHNAFSIEEKNPSHQKENNNEVLYQAIKLGSVSDLSKDLNLFITKSNQVDVKCQEQTSSLAVSPVKKKQTPAYSRKYQPLMIRSRSLDSEKPSTGGKGSRITNKTISSPSEKLFQVTPPKRRSLNLPLKRDLSAAKINEKKKGYDPYDFESASSCEENIQPAATSHRLSMSSLLTPGKKKQNLTSCQNSASKLQTPKEKKKLQTKQPNPTPEENSYKFEKESDKNSVKNVKTSPKSIPDSDCDSPQPKKRSKAKMAKSKSTANNPLPSTNLSKKNPVRSSYRKRKDINYKETSSVGSSISSFSEPVVEHQLKKKKVTPVIQNQNSPPKNMAISMNDQEEEQKRTHKMSIVSDTSESLYNTSHTQQSDMSWINPKNSKSPKIHVEKTYSIKKQISYYGSYACIPKRKHSSPFKKEQTKTKTKKNKEPLPKEQSPQNTSHNVSFMSNGNIDHGSSPKLFSSKSPRKPKCIFSPDHDKGKHRFSLTGSDWQVNKKKKQKKAFIKEPFLIDSIEIQRADSFVMFPEDSRPNISMTESILLESTSRPLSSFDSKSNFSDLEMTLSSTEDPKMLLATNVTNSSIHSLNDDPIISNDLKGMLTPSPYLSIDDLKSNSDRQDLDASKVQLGPTEARVSFKCSTSIGEISHSTPLVEDNIELSPLSSTGGNYKSKCFRKSLFSKRKSDMSDEDKRSPLLCPIDANTFRFQGSSLKKVEYNSKVNFCPSPLSDSDKSVSMGLNDDSSSDDSSQDEGSRNDIRSYLHSIMSPHHQTISPSLAYTNNDNNIKTLIESFTEDFKKAFQTKQCQISSAVEEVLKGTQKALNKICEKDVLKRSDVHHEFNKKIDQVMNELETNASLHKEQKKEVLNEFQEKIKEMQKLKDLQKKGLEKLKMINSLYHESLSSEGRSNQAQQKVQNVMKSQMQKLQNKLLDQARQQEMQQVKKQLRKMLH